jgi:hypothetical protein
VGWFACLRDALDGCDRARRARSAPGSEEKEEEASPSWEEEEGEPQLAPTHLS